MTTKKGFEMRKVCRENIVMAYGRGNINYNKVISLNESAAYLWEHIVGKEFTVETLISLLQQEYDVDAETAGRDAKALLDEWVKAGLVQD